MLPASPGSCCGAMAGADVPAVPGGEWMLPLRSARDTDGDPSVNEEKQDTK